MSNTEAMRAAFEVWHTKRVKDLCEQIAVTTAGWIASGDQDSPATHRTAMFHVLARADETGWVVWQAATEQATAPLEAAIKKVHAAKGRHHSQIAMCDLYELVGLPCVRPVASKGEALEGET